MAEEKDTKQQPEKNEEQAKKPGGKMAGMMLWLVMGGVVMAGAVGGFALSQLLGGDPQITKAQEEAKKAEEAKKSEDPLADYAAPETGEAKGGSAHGGGHGGGSESKAPAVVMLSEHSWAYDKLDSIVANLDEPGSTRYVRVTIILEMSTKVDPAKGVSFLDEKKIMLQDWLTTYMAGLSLEDVRGTKNLSRIKNEIRDRFNSLLFETEKTYVERVLFKEFAVQ